MTPESTKIDFLILQMRELRPREVKLLACAHRASQSLSLYLPQTLLISGYNTSISYIYFQCPSSFHCVCLLSVSLVSLLFVTPWTVCSLPGSYVRGILQARILQWVAIPFFRGSSQLRDWTQVSCIAGRFFTIWDTREAFLLVISKQLGSPQGWYIIAPNNMELDFIQILFSILPSLLCRSVWTSD